MEDSEPVTFQEPMTEAGMDIDLVGDERDLRVVISSMQKAQRARARETYDGIMSLVASLGHHPRKFRREATQRLRAIVSEIYSAPRVTDAARRHPGLGVCRG